MGIEPERVTFGAVMRLERLAVPLDRQPFIFDRLAKLAIIQRAERAAQLDRC